MLEFKNARDYIVAHNMVGYIPWRTFAEKEQRRMIWIMDT